MRILESLLLIWPKTALSRRGNPFPLVADIIQQDRNIAYAETRVMPQVFAFFRRYAMFCMGNMGWKRRVWRGYESLGSEIEFCNTLRERQITFKWLNEAYTTIVK